MKSVLDIAIVGAGVGGLASATALSRLDHRVTVYERFKTPKPVGSGLLLQPTGLSALESLGLRQRIEALGQRIDRLHGATRSGATVFDIRYRDLAPDLYGLGIHRAALHSTLWAGFEHSGARLETGRTITSRHIIADGRVLLLDSDGCPTPAYDLVIDASGARTLLRGHVCRRQSRPFAYGAVWAVVADHGNAPTTLTQRYIDAEVMLGYMPVGQIAPDEPKLAAFFWSLKHVDYDAWRADFTAWQDRASDLWPDLRPTIKAFHGPDDFSLARYAQFTASRLSDGNLVLLGDAAHNTSPQLGQGANQALIDSVTLADAITASADLPQALQAYEKARRDHVRFYQAASWLLTPFFQSDWKAFAWLRNATFNRMRWVPYLKREMIRTQAGLKTGIFTSRDAAKIVHAVNALPSLQAAE